MVPEIGQAANSAMGFASNPFMMLTFIVAPAVLTNASALLAMSTSNRFARAVDRARDLAKQIDRGKDLPDSEMSRLTGELTLAETRALLLMRALRSFYVSLATFALVALVSLLGSAKTILLPRTTDLLFLTFLMVLGLVAFGGLVYGSWLLLRETRMVVGIIQRRIEGIKQRSRSR